MTLFTLLIFLISSWSLATYASRVLRDDMQRLLGEQQFSTVSFIAAEVNYELNDRLKMLAKIAESVSPALLDNAAALQALLERQAVLQDQFSGGVIAYRLDGTVIAEVPRSARRIGVNYMDVDMVAAALKEGKSTIGRPVMDKKLLAPVFGTAVPVRDTRGKVIGALAGLVNLGTPNFLDMLTENRYGKSGYYLLGEPRGRFIITGTDKNRIMQPFPAPGVNRMIDRHVQGYDETGISVNPLGVEVLVSVKRIPVSGWFLVAALPTAEAFAPIRTMQQRILLATFIPASFPESMTLAMRHRSRS